MGNNNKRGGKNNNNNKNPTPQSSKATHNQGTPTRKLDVAAAAAASGSESTGRAGERRGRSPDGTHDTKSNTDTTEVEFSPPGKTQVKTVVFNKSQQQQITVRPTAGAPHLRAPSEQDRKAAIAKEKTVRGNQKTPRFVHNLFVFVAWLSCQVVVATVGTDGAIEAADAVQPCASRGWPARRRPSASSRATHSSVSSRATMWGGVRATIRSSSP